MTGAGAARVCLNLLRPLLGEERAHRAVAHGYAILYLVFYYLSVQYAKAALGLLWVALTPALFLAVYLPVLTYVFKAELPNQAGPYDYALFMIGGFLPWGAFSDGFAQGTLSIVANSSVVRHAPVPPRLLPVIKVTGAFAALMVGTALYLVVLAVLGRFPGVRLAIFPLAAVLLYAFTLGLAWLTSSAAVFVRDILQILPTFLMVEFFAAPVIYSPEMAPGVLGRFVAWNPLTPFLCLFRAALAPPGTAAFAWGDVGLAATWAAIALLLGSFAFRRLQDDFGDAL